jgi:hypothetical protein
MKFGDRLVHLLQVLREGGREGGRKGGREGGRGYKEIKEMEWAVRVPFLFGCFFDLLIPPPSLPLP